MSNHKSKTGGAETGVSKQAISGLFGAYHDKPVKRTHTRHKDGEVVITTPADPDKLKAYRASPDGQREQRRREQSKKDFRWKDQPIMGRVKEKLMQDQEDGIVEEED